MVEHQWWGDEEVISSAETKHSERAVQIYLTRSQMCGRYHFLMTRVTSDLKPCISMAISVAAASLSKRGSSFLFFF